MKTLFIHPHGSNWMPGVRDITTIFIFNIMPLGLLSIIAWLETHGHDSKKPIACWNCSRAVSENLEKYLAWQNIFDTKAYVSYAADD